MICDLSIKSKKTNVFLGILQKEGNTTLVYLVNNLVKHIYLSLDILPNI